MKPHFKPLATVILAALIGGCMPALGAVPLRWNVETSRAQPARYDVYRGETLQLSADLTSYGQPVSMAGTAALYLQTNGMGNAWWTVPATVSSNRIDATLSPSSYPATATTLNCFLGGPATSYRAAFVLRILGAPGPAPNTVEPPLVALDYGTITVLNAPYWTRDEADARYGGSSITATVVTNIAAAVVARDAIPKSYGVAYDLTVGGEFRLSSHAGDGDGVIEYAGNDANSSTEWWIGVPGYWLGTYRLRNPGSGNTATIAYTSDLPDLAPYTAAANVATNAFAAASTHAADHGNPHNVTATQVGAYTRQQTITFFDGHYSGDWDRPRILIGDTSNGPTDQTGVFYGGQLYGIHGEMLEESATKSFRLAWPWGWTGTIATSNMVESVVATIPSTYAQLSEIASVNCSVQTVVDPANNTVPTFQVPAAVPGGVRDWIVHVVSSGQTDITVTGFPATVDGGKTANFFSPIAAADLTKACTHGTVTTFTFTEINATSSAVNFMVMRAELQRVSPSN